MATLLTATQKLKLRSDGHRSKFYLSVSKPRTLLTGLVNNGSIERGAVSIDFDGGAADDTDLIQAGQTLIVTLADGKKYSTSVVSFSGTASSGTITVDANPIAWEDDAALVIYENWEPRTIPPTFDNGTGISKKRGQVWTDQTLPAGTPPVAVLGCHRAGFFPGGTIASQVASDDNDGNVFSGGAGSGYQFTGDIGLGISTLVGERSAWIRVIADIPQGATITSAIIEFTAATTQSSNVVVNIFGEDSDNPTIPVSRSDFYARPRTTAVVNWAPAAWTNGETYYSPDISTVIQEIVDRPGFGNAIQIFLDEDASDTPSGRSFENSDAILHVTYLTDTPIPFNLDGSGSYAVAQGATISSYAWACTGGVIDDDTAATTTIDFTATGQYWLSLTVTDSNGNTHTGRRRIFAHSTDPDNADYPYVDFAVGSVSTSWDGSATAEFEVFGVADFDQFQDGALVLLWKEDWYGTEAGAVGLGGCGDDLLFAGYILGDTIQQDWNNGTVSFRAGNIIEVLKQLPMQGLSIHAESNPAYWFQYHRQMTITRALHWLWYWHSTLYEVADVFLPSYALYKKLFKFQEGSLYAQGQSLADSIFAGVTANRAGQVYVEQDIQALDAAGRAAISELTEIESGDWREKLVIPRRHKKALAGVKLRGYYFNGETLVPYCSIAPSKIRDDSGSGVAPYDGIVVDSQAMANLYSGRRLAGANVDPSEVRLQLAGNYSVVDVVPQYWLTMDLAEADTPRGHVWTNRRLVPRQVVNNIDVSNGLLFTDIICEPEALGPDGISELCPEVPDAVIEDAPWVGVEPALEALVAFGSVNFRDANASDWTEQSAAGADYGAKDVWWTLRQGSTNPQDAILWKVDGAEIYRSLDAGETWSDVTPASNPPNTWSDGTAPGIDSVTFVGIFSDAWAQGRFFSLAEQQIGGLWRGWLAVTDDDGQSWTWVELYDGVTLPAGIRPLWLACNGAYVLVTAWEDDATDILRLLAFDASTLAYSAKYSLGAAAESDVFTNKTLAAYPLTVLDDDDLWFIYGRMNAPQSLANPEQIIKTTDAGSGWASVENTWGDDVCLWLDVGLDSGGDRQFKALGQEMT